MSMLRSGIVSGFLGENRTLAETLLPPNVSPDARNNDYSDGTARKRNGFRRLFNTSYYHGAAQIISTIGANKCILISQPDTLGLYAFTGHCAYSVVFSTGSVISLPQQLMSCYDSSGTTGFKIELVSSSGTKIRLTVYTSSGTQTITHSTAISTNTAYHVMFVYTEGAANNFYTLYVNQTASTNTTATSETYDVCPQGNAYQMILGTGYVVSGTIPDQTGLVTLRYDEIRFWNLGSLSEAQVTTWETDYFTNGFDVRELSVSETDDAKLVGYWRLNDLKHDSEDDWSLLEDATGNNTNTNTKLTQTESAFAWYEALVIGIAIDQFSTALIEAGSILDAGNDQYFILFGKTGPRRSAWSRTAPITALDGFALETSISSDWTNAPWHHVKFRDAVILCNEGFLNAKIYNTTLIRPLVPETPAIGSAAAADSGTGSGKNGGRRYFFVFRNSADSSESDASSIIESAIITDNSGWELTAIPAAAAADSQVDKVDIYATLSNATQPAPGPFYFLATINEGTTTYSDTVTADGVLSTQGLYSPYRGNPDPAKVPFVHDNRLWLLYEDYVAFSEIVGDIIPRSTYDRFYGANVVALGTGDQDVATGVAVAQNTAYIMKRGSVWVINGSTPSSYAARKIVDCPGEGCVAHKSIAQSLKGIYWMSPGGISFMPFGGVPTDITDKNHRGFFEGLTQENWKYAASCWWPYRGEYRISFRTDGEQITLIYNEERQTWAYQDFGVDEYAVVSLKTGEVALFAAWQGYIIELDRGNNDGGYIEDTSIDLEGTLTAASANSVTDSTASFPTTGSRLNGVMLGVLSSGTWQYRRILWNTATKIFVYEDFSPTPAAADAYAIAPIDWRWRSPKNGIAQPYGEDFITRRMWAGFKNNGGDYVVTCEHTTDSNAAISVSLQSGTRIDDPLMDNRGKEISLEFKNPYPEQPVELESFQIGYMRAAQR